MSKYYAKRLWTSNPRVTQHKIYELHLDYKTHPARWNIIDNRGDVMVPKLGSEKHWLVLGEHKARLIGTEIRHFYALPYGLPDKPPSMRIDPLQPPKLMATDYVPVYPLPPQITPQKETAMNIEKTTLIDDKRAEEFSDDTLIELIQREDTEANRLSDSGLVSKSRMVAARAKTHRENAERLIDILDSRLPEAEQPETKA